MREAGPDVRRPAAGGQAAVLTDKGRRHGSSSSNVNAHVATWRGRRCDPSTRVGWPNGRTRRVGANDPMTGRYQYRNHAPVQIRPRGSPWSISTGSASSGPSCTQAARRRHLVIVELWPLAPTNSRTPTKRSSACAMSACARRYRRGISETPEWPFREAVGQRLSQLGVAPQPISLNPVTASRRHAACLRRSADLDGSQHNLKENSGEAWILGHRRRHGDRGCGLAGAWVDRWTSSETTTSGTLPPSRQRDGQRHRCSRGDESDDRRPRPERGGYGHLRDDGRQRQHRDR